MSSSLREKFQDALHRTVSTMPEAGRGSAVTPSPRLQTRSPLPPKASTPVAAELAHPPPSNPGARFFNRYKYPIILVSVLVISAVGYVVWKKYGPVWGKKKVRTTAPPQRQRRQRFARPAPKRARQPADSDDECEDENQYRESAPPKRVRWDDTVQGRPPPPPRAPGVAVGVAGVPAPPKHALPPEEANDPNFTPI